MMDEGMLIFFLVNGWKISSAQTADRQNDDKTRCGLRGLRGLRGLT